MTEKIGLIFQSLTLSQTKKIDSSKLKEFADDNFKLDENGRKFSKRVENTQEKGEIARHEQFLLLSDCFQNACIVDAQKPGFVWEKVKVQSAWKA